MTNTAVAYDKDSKILDSYLRRAGCSSRSMPTRSRRRIWPTATWARPWPGIDGVFFTGGEDVSPPCSRSPEGGQHGRGDQRHPDISDYTLMAYCLSKDVPTLGACRGMQVMSIVSGTGFHPGHPAYYQAKGKTYDNSHRMPADARPDYARHVVDIIETDSWMYDIVGG